MRDSDLPDEVKKLPEKLRTFFNSIMSQIPDATLLARLIPIGALRFKVPQEFTQEEFNQIGRCLTLLKWQWEELGCKGEVRWSFILCP